MLLINFFDQHFPHKCGKGSWNVDVFFCRNSVCWDERVLICEPLETFLCLQVIQLFIFIQSIKFVDAQDNRYWWINCRDNIIDFLFPSSGVLYWLNVSNVANHNHTGSIAAKPAIEGHVGGVHSDQVPHLQSNFVALDIQQLGLEICRNCSFVICIEAIANESIDDWSFADVAIPE